MRRSATAKTSGTVRLQPHWTSRCPSTASQKADQPLWVAWQLDPAAALPFTAAAAGLPGVLDVGSNSPFSVHPMALDSAVLQAVAMVSALPADGTHSAPPAVRSGGLTVTHADRGQAVHADLAAATQDSRGATPQTALHAEDVIRGYRLDVSDADHAGWFSLHARQVSYTNGDSRSSPRSCTKARTTRARPGRPSRRAQNPGRARPSTCTSRSSAGTGGSCRHRGQAGAWAST